MFWSILPFLLVFGILWLATKFNLGNFAVDKVGNLLVPENVWGTFKAFLILLVCLGLPTFLIASYAKRKIRIDNRLYPNSRIRSWVNSLDEDMWTILQVMAVTFLVIVGVIILIFS
jgi:uncharacterized membrane protein